MSWSLLYYVEVEQDVVHAKKWYKEQQQDLDKRFASELKKSIIILQTNPLVYQIKYKNVRVAYLFVFPYGIHYIVNQIKNNITIIGVFHQHRNPELYYNR